jgi:hypothetical protein
MKALTRLGAALAFATVAGTTTAKADAPDIGSGTSSFFTATQNVLTVTFLYSLASNDADLYIFDAIGGTATLLISVDGTGVPPSPGSGAPASITFSLAALGIDFNTDPIIFAICTTNPGGLPDGCPDPETLYYAGPASNNIDDELHATTVTAAFWNGLGFGLAAPAGSTVIGFENRTFTDNPPSDWDYNDIVFAIEGVETTIPEPATMGLLALGLVGLSGAGLIRRRRSNKN